MNVVRDAVGHQRQATVVVTIASRLKARHSGITVRGQQRSSFPFFFHPPPKLRQQHDHSTSHHSKSQHDGGHLMRTALAALGPALEGGRSLATLGHIAWTRSPANRAGTGPHLRTTLGVSHARAVGPPRVPQGICRPCPWQDHLAWPSPCRRRQCGTTHARVPAPSSRASRGHVGPLGTGRAVPSVGPRLRALRACSLQPRALPRDQGGTTQHGPRRVAP